MGTRKRNASIVPYSLPVRRQSLRAETPDFSMSFASAACAAPRCCSASTAITAFHAWCWSSLFRESGSACKSRVTYDPCYMNVKCKFENLCAMCDAHYAVLPCVTSFIEYHALIV